MSSEQKIGAFEGGALRVLESDYSGREVVLALPLNRLLLRVVRVPAGEDPVEVATPILKAASPFPDEDLTVGCELVREDERGKVVLAAALPESAADDIGEALDAAKLNVVKIDSLAIGQLRGVWKALGESNGRRMVLMRSVDCLSIIVLDGDQPSAVRAITDLSDLRREIMLSLLEAEDFGGARKLDEIVVVESESANEAPAKEEPETEESASDGDAIKVADMPKAAPVDPFEALSAFAPVRKIAVGSDAALVGIGERAVEEGTLNVLPASWQEVLDETRFKAKLVRRLSFAGVFWLMIMAVFFGVPLGYGFMTDRQKDMSRQHKRQYDAVKEMRSKVEVVSKYSDHAHGALEMMKAISDRLPGGITLSSWSYRFDEGIRIAGETMVKDETYSLKDVLEGLKYEDKDGQEIPVFGEVKLSGVSPFKGGFRFSLECLYPKEEEE